MTPKEKRARKAARARWPDGPAPKRPYLSLRVKLQAAIHALGLDPTTVEYHHTPPLGLRPRNAANTDWEPAANDPRYITPIDRAEHKRETHGNPTIPRSGDLAKIGHAKAIAEKHAAFRARLLKK